MVPTIDRFVMWYEFQKGYSSSAVTMLLLVELYAPNDVIDQPLSQAFGSMRNFWLFRCFWCPRVLCVCPES